MKQINSQKQKFYRTFSILMIFSGLILMAYMIKVEDEPGLLPILLVITGTFWLISKQVNIKKLNN